MKMMDNPWLGIPVTFDRNTDKPEVSQAGVRFGDKRVKTSAHAQDCSERYEGFVVKHLADEIEAKAAALRGCSDMFPASEVIRLKGEFDREHQKALDEIATLKQIIADERKAHDESRQRWEIALNDATGDLHYERRRVKDEQDARWRNTLDYQAEIDRLRSLVDRIAGEVRAPKAKPRKPHEVSVGWDPEGE